jgi:hypothetical protein
MTEHGLTLFSILSFRSDKHLASQARDENINAFKFSRKMSSISTQRNVTKSGAIAQEFTCLFLNAKPRIQSQIISSTIRDGRNGFPNASSYWFPPLTI